jgi:adenosylhomocysteine nucleosidase
MILVACGVVAEARAAASSDVRAVSGGGDATWLATALDAHAPRAAGIVSWGLAGAVRDDLNVGDWIIGTGVTGGFNATCDAGWRERIAAALPGARQGRIHADGILADPTRKRSLSAKGAIAVDMESHVVARVAAAHRLPFVIVRVVSDAVDDALPPAVRVAMGPRGTTDYRRLLASLARHPGQVPAFTAFAWRSIGCLRVLRAGRVRLGPRLGLG